MKLEEAMSISTQVQEMLLNDENPKSCRDAAALLSMAVEQVEEPFPNGHAFLSWILYMKLQDKDGAKKHANIALKQNPHQFEAQFVKTVSSGQGLNLNSSGFSLQAFSFKSEWEKLLQIYNSICEIGLSAKDFLSHSNRLLALSDGVESAGFLRSLVHKSYEAIYEASCEKINCANEAERNELKTTQLLARGRAKLNE